MQDITLSSLVAFVLALACSPPLAAAQPGDTGTGKTSVPALADHYRKTAEITLGPSLSKGRAPADYDRNGAETRTSESAQHPGGANFSQEDEFPGESEPDKDQVPRNQWEPDEKDAAGRAMEDGAPVPGHRVQENMVVPQPTTRTPTQQTEHIAPDVAVPR